MTSPTNFAILAPVPLLHLQSGEDVAATEGFVAFGSKKWEFFRDVDQRRANRKVPVLLYPSHEADPVELSYVVSWFGWYIEHTEAIGGAHRNGMKHRPPTTVSSVTDNKGHWVVFWHVAGLCQLPEALRLPISEINVFKGGKWRRNAPPRGPELVELPYLLASQT